MNEKYPEEILDLVAKAQRSSGREAAQYWYEAGSQCHEKNPKVAADCYQKSFLQDESFLPVIIAAKKLFYGIENYVMVLHLISAQQRVVGDDDYDLLQEKIKVQGLLGK